MKIFFEKSLKEIQLEKENENYKEKIQQLQQENASLREELELTQTAVNEILFNSLGGE
jgi:cell division protein FtsB